MYKTSYTHPHLADCPIVSILILGDRALSPLYIGQRSFILSFPRETRQDFRPIKENALQQKRKRCEAFSFYFRTYAKHENMALNRNFMGGFYWSVSRKPRGVGNPTHGDEWTQNRLCTRRRALLPTKKPRVAAPRGVESCIQDPRGIDGADFFMA